MAGYLARDVDEWIYIDVADQHPDSMRFIEDCEKAIGKKITVLRSTEYGNVEDCVRVFGGFRNPGNGFAPCTNWLKKRIRKEWESRLESMPQFNHEFPLIDKKLTKEEVHGLFERTFDFARPKMYELGYANNNCVGCVKGGMGYWNHIRKDFPEVFESRAKLERKVGHSMLKDKNGPVYLDELDPNRGDMNTEIMPECGIMCYLSMN